MGKLKGSLKGKRQKWNLGFAGSKLKPAGGTKSTKGGAFAKGVASKLGVWGK